VDARIRIPVHQSRSTVLAEGAGLTARRLLQRLRALRSGDIVSEFCRLGTPCPQRVRNVPSWTVGRGCPHSVRGEPVEP
jgi:hypothetical protein